MDERAARHSRRDEPRHHHRGRARQRGRHRHRRHAVLDQLGWDVEARGLYGAPEIAVIVGEEAHATLLTALQYLGLGRERVTRVRNR